MEHTPTPWQVMNDYTGATVIIANVDGETFSDGTASYTFDFVCDTLGDEGTAHSKAKANAAYIVHCVNSYASLVEENKRMRALAQRSLEMAKVMEGMTGCRGDDEWVWGLMDDLKSALGDTNA